MAEVNRKEFETKLAMAKADLRDQMKLKKDDRSKRAINDAKKRIQTIGEWLNPPSEKVSKARQLQAQVKTEREKVRKEFKAFIKRLDAGEKITFKLEKTQHIDFVFDLIRDQLFDREHPRKDLQFVFPEALIVYFQKKVYNEVSREKIGRAKAVSVGDHLFSNPTTSPAPGPDKLHRGDQEVLSDAPGEPGHDQDQQG